MRAIATMFLLVSSLVLGAEGLYGRSTSTRLSLSVCQLAATSDIVAEVEVIGVGQWQRLSFEGYVQEYDYTPVSVRVGRILKGDLDSGPQTLWIEGYISLDGDSMEGPIAPGQRNRVFLVSRSGRLLVAAQGLFGEIPGGLTNQFFYRAIPARRFESEVNTYKGLRTRNGCPDEGQGKK